MRKLLMNNQEVKKRYKQYKAGKHWVVAPIVFFGLFSTALLGSHESFAAETENPKTVESTVAQTDTPTSPTKETVAVSEGVNLEQTAPNTEMATEPQTVATDNTTPEKVGEQAPSKEENTPVQEQSGIEETDKSEVGKVSTPNSDVNTPEVTPTGNEALDKVVKEAQNNGVDVKEEPEKTVPSKEQADKDFKEQENKVKDTTNAQKEIDKTIKDAVDKAKENGVDVKEKEKQKYKDQQKALEDSKKQAAALEEATKVMNEANKLIEEAINKAKQNGTPIKDGGIINATVKDAIQKAKQIADSIQLTDKENTDNGVHGT